MLKNPNYSAAIKFLKECHFSIIPLGKNKKPITEWEEYQKRLPTEQEVETWWNKYPDANVGIVTGLISNLSVIDLDEVDVAKDELSELISDSLEFPIVKTPSGGQHWYFNCINGNIRNNTRTIPGCDLRANGGYVMAPPSIGIDKKTGKTGKYSFIGTLTPFNSILPYMPQKYLDRITKKNGTGQASTIISNGTIINNKDLINNNTSTLSLSLSLSRPPATISNLTFQNGTRDNDLFTVANNLAKGGMPEADILQVLKNIAKSWGEEHETAWFESKIESAIKRKEHRTRGLKEEIMSFISVTDGYFSVTDSYKALQSVAERNNQQQGVTVVTNRNSVRVLLHRLAKEGVIKRYGDADGVYIRVDDSADEIEWWSDATKPLNVKYPFAIEDMVVTYPRNILCVAGESNSGKTSFALNFAKLNIPLNMPITYCSSEMGAAELRVRLSRFDDVQMSVWRKIKFIERSSNFADIIDPNGINIIDYLEITDNFYKVAQYIKEIHDKLNNGICLVCIQKDKKSDYGRGGAFGLEKPRLYLNMGHGSLKIVKAKAWKTEENPNGQVLNFKLLHGATFIKTHGWHHEG